MKNFSKYTYDSYLRKTRDIMRISIEIFERQKKIVRFVRGGRIFLSESGKAIIVGVIREHFRKYRRKVKISEKATRYFFL